MRAALNREVIRHTRRPLNLTPPFRREPAAPPPIHGVRLVTKTLVLSLPKRTDRRERIADQFKREGMAFEFVDGIDGTAMNFVPPVGWRAGGGAAGCWLGHLAMLDRAQPNDVLHVFEDDALLSHGYAAKLDKLIADVEQLDPQWDAILPGGQHIEPPSETANTSIVKCVNTHRTHDYIVRGDYLRLLRQWWAGIDYHIDHVWGNGSYQRDYRVYAPWPEFLSGQFAGRSNINNRILGDRKWTPRRRTCVTCNQAKGKLR